MSETEEIFENLFNYYKVGSIGDLAKKLESLPSTVSNWKQRNSINAVKKRCRELGIYNDIFNNKNIQKINNISGGQNAQNINGNQLYVESQENNIDKATYGLFIESYQKAKENNDIKGLRIHLMEY